MLGEYLVEADLESLQLTKCESLVQVLVGSWWLSCSYMFCTCADYSNKFIQENVIPDIIIIIIIISATSIGSTQHTVRGPGFSILRVQRFKSILILQDQPIHMIHASPCRWPPFTTVSYEMSLQLLSTEYWPCSGVGLKPHSRELRNHTTTPTRSTYRALLHRFSHAIGLHLITLHGV
jgi:hypothetical protein